MEVWCTVWPELCGPPFFLGMVTGVFASAAVGLCHVLTVMYHSHFPALKRSAPPSHLSQGCHTAIVDSDSSAQVLVSESWGFSPSFGKQGVSCVIGGRGGVTA